MATKAVQDNIEDAADAAKDTVRKAKAKVSPEELRGPSPNIATNLAIADIALRGGSILAREAVERAFLGKRYTPSKAKKILKGRTMGENLLHRMLAKVALRSVPGAIVVGGALMAKTLYDRSKAREASLEGEAKLEDMAEEGEED
ncbi:hypothetical protein [Novosphingobium malaysiense]|uniref:Uncharacterized protein n=1 Tax=Novosphingobium malaysiense TaxID=1348853 RepID=A0A0B1ZL26_9SPHN|nr:hypothetical protein [Novosphingobium malaysiense]KHK89975.1 hypothetical protein LK12_18980 [Novosphingobium malaysiense]